MKRQAHCKIKDYLKSHSLMEVWKLLTGSFITGFITVHLSQYILVVQITFFYKSYFALGIYSTFESIGPTFPIYTKSIVTHWSEIHEVDTFR